MEGGSRLRRQMVKEQILARGVRSPSVLEAMEQVPRDAFVPEHMEALAYDDRPLPIGEGQTISQPFIVAFMAAALELGEGDRVLEVGTGSGYGAAVLAEIASEVYTLERLEALAGAAARRLEGLGYDNVHVIHTDGSRGWPEAAPYDAIAVTAGAPSLPGALREQLVIGGRLVIPVGSVPRVQRLVRVRRAAPDDYDEEFLADVRFVPLVGAEGWSGEAPLAPSLSPTRGRGSGPTG